MRFECLQVYARRKCAQDFPVGCGATAPLVSNVMIHSCEVPRGACRNWSMGIEALPEHYWPAWQTP